MTQITRRNMVGLAAASTVVAACSQAVPGGGGGGGGGGEGGEASTMTNYGDNPSGPAPGGNALAADYYQIVIMRLTSDLKFDASHGSFAASSKDDEAAVRKVVEAQLVGLKPGSDVQSLNPLPGSAGVNFENWLFGSPRRIYVYTDTASLKFQKKEPLSFKSTSSLKAIDEEAARKKKISPNKSFFNATSSDSFAKGALLYFENFYLDNDGKPIPPKWDQLIEYAMNFNMLLDNAKGTHKLPLIFDPDGGNGMGGDP